MVTCLGYSFDDTDMTLVGEEILFSLYDFKNFEPCSKLAVPFSRPCGVPEFVAVDSDAVKMKNNVSEKFN
jgi:hypothetical protein